MNKTFVKYLSIFSYYVAPILLAVISLLYPDKEFFKLLWEWSLYLIIFIVFIKPIALVFGFKKILSYMFLRRQFWVLSFYFAFFHTAGFIYIMKLYSIEDYLWLDNYLFWWAVAMIWMFILYITSNNFSVKLLKANWKKLQYITYPTLFLVVLHVAVLKHEYAWYFLLLTVFVILKTLEYKNVKIKIPYLSDIL